jgi:hypothetical protein
MDRSIAWLRANGIDLFPQKLIPGILAGTNRQARAFDVRGRALSADPRVVGSSLLILRADDAGREAGKFVWPGASK